MIAGQLIAGRYRLRERIGSGGTGVVWRAVDEQLDRTVAVKHIRIEDDERAGRVLRRESRIAAGLRHRNIVVLLDVVTDDHDHCLVMEYLDAPDLAAVLRQRGRLEPRAAAGIGAQLADALDTVHAAGIVHGDVKPSNVLVLDGDIVKLTDFGVSWTISGDATITDTALIRGTPAFLSPEVARGADASTASDLFSLGASLFAAVEGEPPYGAQANPLLALRRAATGKHPPSRHAGPLAPVLEALLAHDPADRPDAARARELLGTVAAGRAVDLPPAHRRRRIIAAAVAVACIIAAAAIWTNQRQPHAPVRSGVGDARTADPCALAKSSVFDAFGDAQTDAHYGNFDRCDVIVQPTSGPQVDVEIQLQAPGPPPDAPSKATGTAEGLRLVRQPELNGECDRTLLLADRNRVAIQARRQATGKADLCGIADAATTHAVSVLDRGALPRRSLLPGSLAQVDACRLLNSAAFAALQGFRAPGFQASRHEAGYGNWECEWDSAATDVSVLLRFDQDESPESSGGRFERLAGHDAYVGADGDHICVARMIHRRYSDIEGSPLYELVHLQVQGDRTSTQLCAMARSLGGFATDSLPDP